MLNKTFKISMGLLITASFFYSLGFASNLIIKGQIINVNDIKKYLTQDSYLQIVKRRPDATISFTLKVENGKLQAYYDSNLPKIAFPQNGKFTFEIDSLNPGSYFIVIQKVTIPITSIKYKGSDLIKLRRLYKKEADKANIATFNVTDKKNEEIIDIGDVLIPLPPPDI